MARSSSAAAAVSVQLSIPESATLNMIAEDTERMVAEAEIQLEKLRVLRSRVHQMLESGGNALYDFKFTHPCTFHTGLTLSIKL